MNRWTLAAAVVVGLGLALAAALWAGRPLASGGFSFAAGSPAPQYAYPSPSYWPLSPIPGGHPPSPAPSPVHRLATPCPPWAPTAVWHDGRGGYFECVAVVPPDPGTGPVVAPCEPALASPYPCPTPTPRRPLS